MLTLIFEISERKYIGKAISDYMYMIKISLCKVVLVSWKIAVSNRELNLLSQKSEEQ